MLFITRVERVFNAEDTRSTSVVELLGDVLLGNIRAAISDANARSYVVELLAVELEELDEQHAEIVFVAVRVDTRMQLVVVVYV